MSVQALAWAFKQKVEPARKIVLLAIANCANEEGNNAFPGQASIAAAASMSRRSVIRHLAWLEEQGYLRRMRRCRIDGTRSSDRYILAMNGLFPPTSMTIIRVDFKQ